MIVFYEDEAVKGCKSDNKSRRAQDWDKQENNKTFLQQVSLERIQAALIGASPDTVKHLCVVCV